MWVNQICNVESTTGYLVLGVPLYPVYGIFYFPWHRHHGMGQAKRRLTLEQHLKHCEMTFYLPDLEANIPRCTGQQQIINYRF